MGYILFIPHVEKDGMLYLERIIERRMIHRFSLDLRAIKLLSHFQAPMLKGFRYQTTFLS